MDKGQTVEILSGYQAWYQNFATQHGLGTITFDVGDGRFGTVQRKEDFTDETGSVVYTCRFNPPGLSVMIPERFLNPWNLESES